MNRIAGKKRHRLGLLLGEIEHRYSYQGILLDSACESAREQDCDLMVFMGHGASSHRTGDFSHTGVYRLAGKPLVDGIIITPPVGGLMSPADRERFLQEMPDIPMVFTGMVLPGHGSIQVDNRAGMAELMDHLCTAHNFSHVACIRGPEDNQEAISRFDEFCEGLRRHGRKHDPDLVMTGNFTSSDGYLLARELREVRGKTFDALVAANDQMALGAMEYLQSQGLKVPGDVAIFGFDDIRISRDSNPTLTTVRQPLMDQMPEAMRTLLTLIDEGKAEHRVLPTKLVIRESCGCSEDQNTGGKSGLVESLMDLIHSPGICGEGHECRKIIKRLINDQAPGPDELNQATDLVRTRLLDWISEAAPGEREDRRDKSDMVLQELHLSYHTSLLREVAGQYTVMGEMNLIIRRITTARTLEDLKSLLDLELPRLGIQSYSLAVCGAGQGNSPRDRQSRVQGILEGTGFDLSKQACGVGDDTVLLSRIPTDFHILAGNISNNPGNGTSLALPTGLQCPPGMGTSPEWLSAHEGQNLIILPLVTVDSWLGIAMFPLTRENAFYCYGLHDLLANILDREYRLKELVDINIKERISRMAEEGRMRSLNSLVTGVAHEINTPIGVGITSASYLEQLLKSTGNTSQASLQSGESWTDILSCLRLVNSSLNKVKVLMDRFKLLAQDLDEEIPVSLDLDGYLNGVIGNFLIGSARKDLDLELHCASMPALPLRGRTLGIALQAMLENACKHAYAGLPSGRVDLVAYLEDRDLVIEVRDFGQGMSQEDCTRIFEPYGVMRREGGGMGIGMHITWNLVVFKLRGKITCQSQQGKGTTFSIRLPVDARQSS